MKVVRRIVKVLATILAVVFVGGWIISDHFEAGPSTISPAIAITLLNNCDRFTHIRDNTRQATAVTRVTKGGPHADDGAYYSNAAVNWRWISGPKSAVEPGGQGKATFLWNPVHGDLGNLRDWKFPESGWVVKSFDQPGDEPSFDCKTAMLIQ